MVDYSVFDSLFDSVIVIDSDRKITYCNEAAAALAGSSVRRLSKGVVFSAVYELSDSNLFPMSGGEVGRDSAAPMQELNFKIVNSERIGKLQVTVQPFQEEGQPRWAIVMHDVTLEETLHVKYQGELEQKEGYIRELQAAKAQLEDYSKNLEKMVEARTAEVRHANRMLNAIMNSLGQGFLVFDSEGSCSDIFTKACEDILETNPSGKKIWDVLRLDKANIEQFKMWIQAVYSDALPFDSLIELAPNRYAHSAGRYVTINFYPIRSDEEKLSNLVLVATDRTREHEAEVALAKEQQYIQMVLKVIKGRDQFGQFLTSARNLIEKLKGDLVLPVDKFDFSAAFRTLHTLEGEAALFSAMTIRQKSRACQEILEPFKRGDVFDPKQMFNDLKQSIEALDAAYSEFLSAHKELLDVLRVGDTRNVEISLPKLLGFAKLLDESPTPLFVRERFSEDLFKQPLSNYIRHYGEVAQHVAQVQGKKISPVEFNCDGVRVPPGHIDGLVASMVHVFRNAADHGIEDPNHRKQINKPEFGNIHVDAESFGHERAPWVRLIVTDDGAGIDPVKIRAKLKEKFPDRDYTSLSDRDVIQTIFLPGFTSKEAVGEFSGRGIGMDAVKTEVERLNGRVWVESSPNIGTKLIIEFPESPASSPVATAA